METIITRETPVYSYQACMDDEFIKIYADDLRNAKVGDHWSCEDQDRYPNRTAWWHVTATLTYKDQHGYLIITTFSNGDKTKATWIELHDQVGK